MTAALTGLSSVLSGPYLASATLLAGAGFDKAWRPAGTARALAMAGLRIPRVAVRAGGAAEAVVGLLALSAGGPVLAGLVGASYFVLAMFVGWALLRGTPLSSCGCFGQEDIPPTWSHVILDLAAGAVATAVASGHTVTVAGAVRGQPLLGLPLLVLAAAVGFLMFLVLTSSARLVAIRRGGFGGGG